MFERLRERVSRKPIETSQQWFEEEEVFENLVRDGRVPSFWDCGKITLVVLPPEGVKPGDEYELPPGGGQEYFAPNGGPSKGLASLHEVTPRVAKELKIRKNKVLEEMGLQTS